VMTLEETEKYFWLWAAHRPSNGAWIIDVEQHWPALMEKLEQSGDIEKHANNCGDPRCANAEQYGHNYHYRFAPHRAMALLLKGHS
jgi:hypothetical protein